MVQFVGTGRWHRMDISRLVRPFLSRTRAYVLDRLLTAPPVLFQLFDVVLGHVDVSILGPYYCYYCSI